MLRFEAFPRTRFAFRKDGDQMSAFRQGPPWIKASRQGRNEKPILPLKRRDMEAEAGIEPTYEDLQSSA